MTLRLGFLGNHLSIINFKQFPHLQTIYSLLQFGMWLMRDKEGGFLGQTLLDQSQNQWTDLKTMHLLHEAEIPDLPSQT